MAKNVDDINKPNDQDNETLRFETVEDLMEELNRPAGFHVMVEGQSLGCYPTDADAEAFASGHLTPQGIDYTVEEVA